MATFGMRVAIAFFSLIAVGCPRLEPADAVDGGIRVDAVDGGIRVDAGPAPDVCGDLVVGASETCDDGDEVDGDGCSSLCRRELCAAAGSVLRPNARRTSLASRAVESFAVADFNADGHNDVATISSDSLAVFTFNADGAFRQTFFSILGQGESVVALDLNGDDAVDLVIADEHHGVSCFVNDGVGGFAAAVLLSDAFGGEQLAAADVDRDGRLDLIVARNGLLSLDLAVARGDGSIRVLFADGPLAFSGRDFAVGVDPESFVVADLDGDGRLDIASANEESNNVVVLLNAGERAFVQGVAVDVGRDPESIVSADLDDDGDLDLAVANGFEGIDDDTVSLLENDGVAGFTVRAELATGIDPFALIAADLDGDGLVDLASADRGEGALSIFRRSGAFTFAPRETLVLPVPVGETAAPVALAAGDLDGDCLADLFVGMKNTNAVAIGTACGDGARGFGEGCDDGNAIDDDGCDSNCSVTACGNGITAGAELCDDGNLVDSDGCDSNCTPSGCGNGVAGVDEACDDGNPENGDGCDSNCTPSRCGNGVADATERCDDGNAFDDDGCDSNCTETACGNGIRTSGELCDDGNVDDDDGCDADCASSTCADGTRDRGEVCFAPSQLIASDPGQQFRLAGVADLNDDGLDDVVVMSAAGVTVFFGVIGARIDIPTSNTVRAVATVDMDTDGDLDLVVAQAGNGRQIVFFPNNGGGDFGAGVVTDLGFDSAFGFAVAEFDGVDGPDVVIVQDEPAKFFSNDGSGGLLAPRSLSVGGCKSLFVTDIDGDADNDIVANCGALTTLRNDGSGTFSLAEFLNNEVTGDQFASGNIDSDGELDVVVGSINGADLYRGNGVGGFTSTRIGGTAIGVALGDIDGDGVLDLALGGLGTVRFLLGSGTGSFTEIGALRLSQSGDHQLAFVDNADALELVSISEDRIELFRLVP